MLINKCGKKQRWVGWKKGTEKKAPKKAPIEQFFYKKFFEIWKRTCQKNVLFGKCKKLLRKKLFDGSLFWCLFFMVWGNFGKLYILWVIVVCIYKFLKKTKKRHYFEKRHYGEKKALRRKKGTHRTIFCEKNLKIFSIFI